MRTKIAKQHCQSLFGNVAMLTLSYFKSLAMLLLWQGCHWFFVVARLPHCHIAKYRKLATLWQSWHP